MKISNASKKVLASALSAAMVVAFAPAVALAEVHEGDTVTVKFDTTGLTLAEGSSAISDQVVKVGRTKNEITLKSDTFTGHVYNDASGNEVTWGTSVASGNVKTGDLTLENIVASAVVNGSTITLKPVAAASAVKATAVTCAQEAAEDTTAKTALAFEVKNTTTAGYTAVLKKDGAEISRVAVDGSATSVEFKTVSKNAETLNGQFASSLYGAGKFSVDFVNAKGEVVGTQDAEVTDVTLTGIFKVKGTARAGQSIKAVVGQGIAGQLTAAYEAGVDVVANKTTDDDASEAVAYAADGEDVVYIENDGKPTPRYTFYDGTDVTSGMALTAVYGVAPSAQLGYEGGKLKLTIKDGYGEDAIGSSAFSAAKADIELTGAVSRTLTGEKVSSYEHGDEIYVFGTAGAPAGTYEVKVKITYGSDSDEKTVECSAKAVLAKVTFEGAYGTAPKANTVINDGSLDAYKLGDGKDMGSLSADDLKHVTKFCGWSLDGTTLVTSADKIAADATSVTLKAVYHTVAETYKPAYSYADKTLTLSTDKGDGYELQFSTDSLHYNKYAGPVAVADPTLAANKDKEYYAKVVNSANADLNSAVLELIASYTTAENAKTWAAAVVANATSDSTKTAPKYYGDALETAAADAQAAINAIGYAESEDFAAALLTQQKKVLADIAAYEKAQIDAYAAGVADEDGNVKKANETQVAAAKAAVDQVIADVDVLTGSDTKVKTAGEYKLDGDSAAKKQQGAKLKDTFSSTDASVLVAAITKATTDLAASATTYAKADVDAAAAVTAQLEAAKDATAAKAALEAYQALTDTQKALVSADALKAAHTIVDAQAVIDEQDQAAVKYCNSTKTKTVKLAKKAKKTAKKFSVKWNSKVSESGNKVTYKKKSGSAKVTVSANGKATLKKGVKKGTYKAKVKVSCGNATRTVTAKFIVK